MRGRLGGWFAIGETRCAGEYFQLWPLSFGITKQICATALQLSNSGDSFCTSYNSTIEVTEEAWGHQYAWPPRRESCWLCGWGQERIKWATKRPRCCTIMQMLFEPIEFLFSTAHHVLGTSIEIAAYLLVCWLDQSEKVNRYWFRRKKKAQQQAGCTAASTISVLIAQLNCGIQPSSAQQQTWNTKSYTWRQLHVPYVASPIDS